MRYDIPIPDFMFKNKIKQNEINIAEHKKVILRTHNCIKIYRKSTYTGVIYIYYRIKNKFHSEHV